MEMIMYFLPFFATIGAVLLLVGFRNKFKTLSKSQKIGIVLVEVGILVPTLVDFTNGFIIGFMGIV